MREAGILPTCASTKVGIRLMTLHHAKPIRGHTNPAVAMRWGDGGYHGDADDDRDHPPGDRGTY